MLFGLNIATRDITAVAIAISFNIMLSILPPPLKTIIHFIMPYFMFVFVETVAAHKWTSVLLITGFYTIFFYSWAIPRFELLKSFAEQTWKIADSVSNIISTYLPPAAEPYEPSFNSSDATSLTIFILIIEPFDYIVSYLGAKGTVEKLKLKERIGGLR